MHRYSTNLLFVLSVVLALLTKHFQGRYENEENFDENEGHRLDSSGSGTLCVDVYSIVLHISFCFGDGIPYRVCNY